MGIQRPWGIWFRRQLVACPEAVVSGLTAIALIALAALEASLVALPKPTALVQLERLQSPWWALALPGSILVGTFAPLWEHPLATVFLGLAAVVTPLLAVVAATNVARGPRNSLVAALVLAMALTFALGRRAELAASIVTAFGCMALGVALTRLIPRRWLFVGIGAMACLDVLLMVLNIGQPEAALMADAASRFHGRAFNAATVGPIQLGYPDLVAAGVLGGFVAGRSFQRRAALVLGVLAASCGMLVAVIHIVPSTPPVAATFILVAIWERTAVRRGRRDAAVPPRPLASTVSSGSLRVADARRWTTQAGVPARDRLPSP